MSTTSVLDEVWAERISQDTKWGEQNHDLLRWNAILGEEVGEVAKATIEREFCVSEQAREGFLSEARAELIQVAAVAVAAVESLDRYRRRKEQHSAYANGH